MLWLRFVLFQPVESEGLRFVLLQPLEGCQPLTFVDWESTLETSEIREPTLETFERLLQPLGWVHGGWVQPKMMQPPPP